MRPQRFHSRRLPGSQERALLTALADEHADTPFSPVDPRSTVRRVTELGSRLGLATRVFRGGLDLQGTEADHVWVSVEGVVLDAAFPVLAEDFVEVLRRYVAGEAEAADLEAAAEGLDVDARVVGQFPDRLGYVGSPVWAERHRGGVAVGSRRRGDGASR